MEPPANYLNLKFSVTDIHPSIHGSLQLEITLQNFRHSDQTSLLRTSAHPISPQVQFSEYLTVAYHFHLKQSISISIINPETGILAIQSVSLCHILHPHTKIHVRNYDSTSICTLNTFCEETISASKSAFLMFQGRNLADLDAFSKSDPYFKLYSDVNGEWKEIYRSKVVDDSLDPQWEEFVVNTVTLNCGKVDNKLKIEVFDYDSETSSEIIGDTEILYSQLIIGAEFQLINPKNQRFGGFVQIIKFEIIDDKSFVEFLVQGISINLTIGFDFTASNGLFNQETCLHHISPTEENDYQKVIKIIGSVLSEYDQDKKFLLLGFGAESPKIADKNVFPLCPSNPYIAGYDKVNEVYKQVLEDKNFVLSGPTHFSSILQYQMNVCRGTGENIYHVLLIITDGVMHDEQETINCLIEASQLPMSVIIVGVGFEDFTRLKKLDSDKTLLQNSSGKKSSRDIVQFIPFNLYRNNFEAFAQEAMSEIPTQILAYKKLRHMF